MRKITTLILITIIGFSCIEDDRNGFEPVRPSITFENPTQTGTRGEVIDFNYNIFSGSDIVSIVINNKVITPSTTQDEKGVFREDRVFSFTVPNDAPVGSDYIFNVTMTDELGREILRTLRIPIEKQSLTLSSITTDTKLDSTFNYIFEEDITISNNATLTIPAGTNIVARASDENQLLITVETGSRLVATGTAENPVVFTTDDGLAGIGESGTWAGIEIYGDDGNPMDDSGSLRYVRIEYAGTADDDSSLFLEDVGSGTTIDHVQVFGSAERGIFVRDGRVNFKHVVGVNNQGATLYLRSGYQGNVQFLFVNSPDKDLDHGDRDIHIRSDGTAVTMANMTLIGNGAENEEEAPGELLYSLDGARIRSDDITYKIYNSIVAEYPDDGLRIQNYTPGLDTVDYSFIFRIGSADDGDGIPELGGSDALRGPGVIFFNTANNQIDPSSTLIPGIGVNSYLPDQTQAVDFNPASLDPFFDAAMYAGAFEAGNDWAIQWIRDADGNIQIVRPEVEPEVP